MNEEQAETVETDKKEESKFRVRTILSDSDVITLRKVSEPVSFITDTEENSLRLDEDMQELNEALRSAVTELDGLGMAAPQLGVNVRMFVMRQPFSSNKLLAVINPEIVRGYGFSTKTESCFSIPSLPANVKGARIKRMSEIVVRFQNENGIEEETTLVGMDARTFQHELDHLNGKLMLDEPGFKGWERLF